MSVISITAKFDSKCRLCGQQINKGARAFYNGDAVPGKKLWHVTCPSEDQPAKPADAPAEPAPVSRALPAPVFMEFDYSYLLGGAAELADPAPHDPINEDVHDRLVNRDAMLNGAPTTWWGFPSKEAGIKAFREGWPEGAERLSKALESVRIEIDLQSRRRQVLWTDMGDEVDMQRVYSGRLDSAFRTTRRRNRSAPGVVTIVAIQGLDYTQSSERLFWTGAAVLKLTEQLEAAGHSVEVLVVQGATRVTHGGKSISVTTTAKEAGAQLDMGAMAGVVCSGMTTRYFGMAQKHRAGNAVTKGHGFPTQSLPAHLEGRERILVASAESIGNAAQAAQWVADAAVTLATQAESREAA